MGEMASDRSSEALHHTKNLAINMILGLALAIDLDRTTSHFT